MDRKVRLEADQDPRQAVDHPHGHQAHPVPLDRLVLREVRLQQSPGALRRSSHGLVRSQKHLNHARSPGWYCSSNSSFKKRAPYLPRILRKVTSC